MIFSSPSFSRFLAAILLATTATPILAADGGPPIGPHPTTATAPKVQGSQQDAAMLERNRHEAALSAMAGKCGPLCPIESCKDCPICLCEKATVLFVCDNRANGVLVHAVCPECAKAVIESNHRCMECRGDVTRWIGPDDVAGTSLGVRDIGSRECMNRVLAECRVNIHNKETGGGAKSVYGRSETMSVSRENSGGALGS